MTKTRKFNQEINVSLTYPFEIETEGVYAITVKASCKPGWRNQLWLRFRGLLENILDLHLDDDDLRVEIDATVFKKLKGKRGLFNSPAAFSGTKILGKTKIVIFLLFLTKGSHTIKFIPDGSPYLGEVEITQLLNPLKFVFQPNTRAEDENYYAWYTVAVVDQPLYAVSLTAQTDVQQEGKDDDDLKILINEEVQKRPGNKHPHVYFCGFSAKGREENFTKEVRLLKGTHYIELLADKTPLLKSVELALSEKKLLQAKVVWESANLREEPDTASNSFTQLSKGDTVELLEKAVQGERPKNEQGLPLFSDRWHKVYYKGQTEGYVYSEAVEIEGEDKETIKNLIRRKSKELAEDENLMLAITEKESHFSPYAVGQVNPGVSYEGVGKGLMQINDITAREIRENSKINYNLEDVFDIKQNIEGGIRYFRHLRSLYKKDDSEYLEKLLVSWNCGPGCIGNRDASLDYSLLVLSVREFVEEVKRFYQWYETEKNQTGASRFLLLLIGGVLVFAASLLISQELLLRNQPARILGIKVGSLPTEYRNYIILRETEIDVDKDGRQERLVVVNTNKDYLSIGISKLLLVKENGDFLELSGKGEGFNWWQVGDFNQNSQMEIAIMYENSGNGAYNPFYLYEWNGEEFQILLENKNGGNWDELIDMNGDGLLEILHTFLITKWGPSWVEVFQWDDREKQKYVKANHKFPDLYEKWLKEEMNRNIRGELLPYSLAGVPGYRHTPEELKEVDLKRKLSECLIEEAVANYNGIFADAINDCVNPYWEQYLNYSP